jgi:uncharacterized protein (TIGR03437 family)
MRVLRASVPLLLAPLLFFSAFPSRAQTDSYQFITLDASAFNRTAIDGTDGPFGNYVPAKQTLIGPAHLAVDAAGNVYFSEYLNIREITTGGVLVPVAGDVGSFPSYCCGGGDGGPALLAGVIPLGIAFDPSGNLWFTDQRPALRRISPSGIVGTVEAFDGSIAVDPNGNVYVAARTVQKVSPDGTVTQYPNTDTPSVSNQLQLGGIAADSAGVVYGANSNDHIVQKIEPNGVITTLAGNGTAGYSGDGGPALVAEVDNPWGVAVDAAGNVYFGDHNRGVVRKVSTNGIITTVAGGGAGFGEGGQATKAILNNPTGVAIDKAGNLYISEIGFSVALENPISYGFAMGVGGYIRKVTADGNIHTLAGLLPTGCCGDGGPVSKAFFTGPSGLARDSQGNVYVADPLQQKVRRIAADLTVTTIAGSGLPGFAGDNGPAAAAVLNTPQGVAVDGAGNVYIADSGNNRIRMVAGNGNIRTIAGNGIAAFSGDGGAAASASLSGPNFVLADTSGNLFIADTANHRIRKITPDGIIHTIAGNGTVGFTGDGGPAIAAELETPRSVAVDASGNLYIVDNPVHTVRKVGPSGIISTFAGTPGQQGYAGDGGPANLALLNSPYGVAVDGAGNVLIADTGNNTIRKVTPDGGISSIPPDGSPTPLALNTVLALAPDPNGNLYVASAYGPVGYAYMGASPFPRFAPSVPWIGIRNAAGGRGSAVAPGMLASIYGGNLGPQQGVTAGLDASGNFGDSLGGVQVFVNGIAAPILYAQTGQVNFIVPFEIAAMSTADIYVAYNGLNSITNTLPVTPTFPGMFAGLNQNGTLNGSEPGEPAPQGTVLQMFATGGGLTNPGEVDGVLVTGPLPVLLAQVQATIEYYTGGQVLTVPAPVRYAGPAPTLVAGMLQVNVQIPTLPGLSMATGVPILTIYVNGASASVAIQIQ